MVVFLAGCSSNYGYKMDFFLFVRSEDSDLERYLLLNAESRQIERFEATEGTQAKEKLGRDFWRPFRGD